MNSLPCTIEKLFSLLMLKVRHKITVVQYCEFCSVYTVTIIHGIHLYSYHTENITVWFFTRH